MHTYMNTVFKNPKEIYTGRNMKNKHYFSIIFMVTAFITILSIIGFIPAAQSVQEDFEEIRNSIPEFQLENDQLSSEGSSYVYQTDSLLFYFDAEDNIDTELIDDNMDSQTVPVSVGVLKDGLYANLLGRGYSLAYSDIENFTAADLDDLFLRISDVSIVTLLLVGLFMFLFQFFSFFYQLFVISLVANIMVLFSGLRLRLLQTMKMTLLANIIPMVLATVVSAFVFPVYYQFEIVMIMTLIIFYISLNEMKKRIKTNNA